MKLSLRRINKNVFKIGTFIVAISFILMLISSGNILKRFVEWSKRCFALRVLKFIDVEEIKNSRCLLANPFIRTNNNFDDICEVCETVNDILDDNTTSWVDAVHSDIPFVKSDLDIRNDAKNISVKSFVDSFLSIYDLSLFEPCQFFSNRKSRVADHRGLLNLVSSDDVQSVYVLWENCAQRSFRAFRSLYSRPSFLTPNVQLTGTNWAMICKDYNNTRFRAITIYFPLQILMVQKGDVEIKLVPLDVCTGTCRKLSRILTQGDVLIYHADIYQLFMKPSCAGEEMIVIGVGGYTD